MSWTHRHRNRPIRLPNSPGSKLIPPHRKIIEMILIVLTVPSSNRVSMKQLRIKERRVRWYQWINQNKRNRDRRSRWSYKNRRMNIMVMRARATTRRISIRFFRSGRVLISWSSKCRSWDLYLRVGSSRRSLSLARGRMLPSRGRGRMQPSRTSETVIIILKLIGIVLDTRREQPHLRGAEVRSIQIGSQ